MRPWAAVIAAVLSLSLAPAATATTRTGAITLYADQYAATEGWVLTESPAFDHGDFRRSYFTVRYLANPAPGASNCFGDIVYVDMPGCPTKFFQDDGPFWMDVEARVVRCGPGWFVVSTPLDRNTCHPLLRW